MIFLLKIIFLNLLTKFIHFIKLSGFALFFPIRFLAVPWSGDIRKYFKPKVTLTPLNLKMF